MKRDPRKQRAIDVIRRGIAAGWCAAATALACTDCGHRGTPTERHVYDVIDWQVGRHPKAEPVCRRCYRGRFAKRHPRAPRLALAGGHVL